MKGIEDTKKELPILKNDEEMFVYLQGSHFQQNNVLTSNNDHVINNNVINVYIVYKLDSIDSIRDTTFTIQNGLFGAMQITKNAYTIKDMVYVLMKVSNLLTYEKKAILIILHWLET